MSAIYKFLFPTKLDGTGVSLLLLAFRILFGVLLMSHGIQKLMNFDSLSAIFPDPLGVGSHISLTLAIFGELICSIGFILGAFYRLAMIPMIFTMCMAFFVFHANDTFSIKELAFVYLGTFVILYIAGPGKYSLDYLIATELHKRIHK